MTRRPSWWLPLVIVLLIGIPIFEVWLLIQVGEQIGVLATVAILIGEAVLGGWLMKREGNRAWTALNESLRTGKMPSGELADAAFVLVGGVLLMLPGFATDLLGFFFLLPFTRPIARHILAFFIARQVNRSGLPVMRVRLQTDDLIEGETVADGSASAPRRDSTRPPAQSDPRVIEGTVVPGDPDDQRP